MTLACWTRGQRRRRCPRVEQACDQRIESVEILTRMLAGECGRNWQVQSKRGASRLRPVQAITSMHRATAPGRSPCRVNHDGVCLHRRQAVVHPLLITIREKMGQQLSSTWLRFMCGWTSNNYKTGLQVVLGHICNDSCDWKQPNTSSQIHVYCILILFHFEQKFLPFGDNYFTELRKEGIDKECLYINVIWLCWSTK